MRTYIDEDNEHPVKDADHALRCGMALGAAMQAGLDVSPVSDEQGNYTAAFVIEVDPVILGREIHLTVVVQ